MVAEAAKCISVSVEESANAFCHREVVSSKHPNKDKFIAFVLHSRLLVPIVKNKQSAHDLCIFSCPLFIVTKRAVPMSVLALPTVWQHDNVGDLSHQCRK